ncbi:MAG TPA: DNA mismatch repair protein MutS, partial [Ruminococcaceae bacterium]|nr:DNA mismatch repair protein MutS [Oscillospiraceae bacterium]
LEDSIDGVKNYNIAVKKRGDDITFLRRIVRGGADDSYGIEVAKLAGVPDRITSRAKKILAGLERDGAAPKLKGRRKKEDAANGQMSILPPQYSEIMSRLKSIDIDTLTPIECMNELFSLVKIAKS